jgi:hypothetical protein
MTAIPIIVHGTVRPDGTLELDEKVPLPVGRIQVTIQPAPEASPPAEDWWRYLQRARTMLEARGTGFRSEEEIEAERESFREGADRIEEVHLP